MGFFSRKKSKPTKEENENVDLRGPEWSFKDMFWIELLVDMKTGQALTAQERLTKVIQHDDPIDKLTFCFMLINRLEDRTEEAGVVDLEFYRRFTKILVPEFWWEINFTDDASFPGHCGNVSLIGDNLAQNYDSVSGVKDANNGVDYCMYACSMIEENVKDNSIKEVFYAELKSLLFENKEPTANQSVVIDMFELSLE